jgi:hypothetical protein
MGRIGGMDWTGGMGKILRVLAMLSLPAVPALSAFILHAEPLSRLRGTVIATNGEAIAAADLRVEARFGFGGGAFTGQRTYATKTNAHGEWSIIGFTAGIWVFDASAPGYLPHVVALPFNLVTPAGQGLDTLPTWQPVLRLAPAPTGDVGRQLADAENAARLGESGRVTPVLEQLGIESNPDILAAAGHICLLMHDAATARAFFHQAQGRDPKSYAAALGMASTALLQKDFDTAGRAFGTARGLTSNKAEQAYITAAIRDLSKIHVTAP